MKQHMISFILNRQKTHLKFNMHCFSNHICNAKSFREDQNLDVPVHVHDLELMMESWGEFKRGLSKLFAFSGITVEYRDCSILYIST